MSVNKYTPNNTYKTTLTKYSKAIPFCIKVNSLNERKNDVKRIKNKIMTPLDLNIFFMGEKPNWKIELAIKIRRRNSWTYTFAKEFMSSMRANCPTRREIKIHDKRRESNIRFSY